MWRILLVFCASVAPLWASELPTPASPHLPELAEIPVQRAEIKHQLVAHALQRKEIVADNMGLTAAQAAIFWPLYEDYRDRVGQLTDAGLQDVVAYAKATQQGPIREADAELWMNRILERESLRQALRKSYLLKMEQALSAVLAMRFMQIDGQLDARLRADLLGQIPLKI